MVKSYQWKIYKGINNDELTNDWKEILKRNELTSFLHSREWYQSLLESSYLAPDLYAFFVLYQNNKVIAIIPLEYSTITRFGMQLKTWLLLGIPNLGLNEFIVDKHINDNWLSLLVEALSDFKQKHWDLLLFQDMPNSLELNVVKKSSYWLHKFIEYDHTSKYIDCSKFEYKERRIVKRMTKKLAKLGEVKTYFYSDSYALKNAFEEFLMVEASGFKGEMKTALLYDKVQQSFYRSLLNYFGKSGHCLIQVLKVNDKTIASHFALIIGKTYYMLKIGFDDDYKSFSPGTILIGNTIKHFSNNPHIDTIDFVTGLDWHDQWKPSISHIYNYYFYKTTPKGFAAFMIQRIISYLRKVMR